MCSYNTQEHIKDIVFVMVLRGVTVRARAQSFIPGVVQGSRDWAPALSVNGCIVLQIRFLLGSLA